MPVHAGTSAPTFRLGTTAVSRMYLGSALAFDGSPADVGGGRPVGGLLAPSIQGVQAGDASVVLTIRYGPMFVFPMPSSFSIQYSTNMGESWTSVAPGFTYSQTISSGVLTGTATIGSLSPATYLFRAAGVNSSGIGPYSLGSSRAIIHSTPTTPAGMTAAVSGSNVALYWAASTGSGPLIYLPQFSTDAGATWRSTVQTPDTYYLFPGGLAPGLSCVFRVYATYDMAPSGISQYAPQSAFSSSTAPVTAPVPPPSQPNLEEGTPVEGFSGGASIRFVPPVSGSGTVTEYRVYVDPLPYSPAAPATLALVISASDASYVQYPSLAGGDTRAFTLTGLTNGTSYRVLITAFNPGGESPPCEAIVTPFVRPLPLESFAATPIIPPGQFVYTGGVSWPVMPWNRAVSLAWNPAPYGGADVLFEFQWRPVFGSATSALDSTPLWYPRWDSDLGRLSPSPPRMPDHKGGNTIDTLLPNTAYVVRARQVGGPWSYATVTTAP